MDKKQFKEMPLKKKLQWLMQYYGVTAIVTLLIVFVAVWFIKSVFFADPIEDVCVLIYSDEVLEEECARYKEEIEKNTGHSAEVVVYHLSDAYGSQAFAAKVGTDQTDVVIAPEHEMTLLNENGFLRSYAQIEGTQMYMGIPMAAREGDLLKYVLDYLDKQLQG